MMSSLIVSATPIHFIELAKHFDRTRVDFYLRKGKFHLFMHYILFYELADDYLTRRAQFRAEHLGLVRKAHENGTLVLAGALAEPADEAILIFNGPTSEHAEDFAENDPYVKNGLVTSWRVRKWITVIGEGSSPP